MERASRGHPDARPVPRRRGARGAREFSIAIAGIGAAGGVEPELGALAGAYVLRMAVLGPMAAKPVDPLVLKMQERTTGRPRSASSS